MPPTRSPVSIPGCSPNYLTHTFGVDEVQAAFELACRPAPERIKIAIVA